MNNTKQLTLGWKLYASDNNNRLVNNLPGDPDLDTWVGGHLNFDDDNADNTNLTLIENALLFPYVKSAAVYKCPVDPSQTVMGPRVRSYSIQCFVGAVDTNNPNALVCQGFIQFLKDAQFVHPSDTLVFVDEHPNTINDGFWHYWYDDPLSTADYGDLPASYHDGACGLSCRCPFGNPRMEDGFHQSSRGSDGRHLLADRRWR